MSDEEQLFLRVLDGDAPDSPDAQAISHDLGRIRRGMELVAAAPAQERRLLRHRRGLAVAAVAAAAAVAMGAVVVTTRDVPRRDVADPPRSASPSSGPTLGFPGAQLTLEQRVTTAEQIVVGTLTAVERRVLPGDAAQAYVLATVAVTEWLKPDDGARTIVALDHDTTAGVTTSGAGRPWRVGDEVLLFLVNDAGTVTQDVRPAHVQVSGGESGRYLVVDGRLDAPFTLDDVRGLAR